MALSDYLKGPQHKARAEHLEKELSASQLRCKDTESELSKLKDQYEQLLVLATKYGAMEIAQVRNEITVERHTLHSVREAVSNAQAEVSTVADQLNALKAQVLVVDESLLLESFALYLPKFKLTNTTEYKQRLEHTRVDQKEMIKTGTAATGNMNWEVNGKKSEGKKLVNDMIKLVIRSFNNECDSCVDNVKFDNVELGKKRILQSFEACNKLGRVMSVELSAKYFDAKLDELHLAHEYQMMRQEEKENAKRIREELREQQKLEQEIRAARDKITKERKHFSAALKDLQARLEKANSEEDRAALKSKMEEVEAAKAALDEFAATAL